MCLGKGGTHPLALLSPFDISVKFHKLIMEIVEVNTFEHW